MSTALVLLCCTTAVALGLLWSKYQEARRKIDALGVKVAAAARRAAAEEAERQAAFEAERLATMAAQEAERARVSEVITSLEATVARLAKWEGVADADAQARQLVEDARTRARALTEAAEQARSDAEQAAAAIRQAATAEADQLRAAAKTDADEIRATARVTAERMRSGAAERAARLEAEAAAALDRVNLQVEAILAAANAKAEALAGDALRALHQAQDLERTVAALEHTIKGYGDAYLVPGRSLLDDLAEAFSHEEGGRRLAAARDRTRRMIRAGQAAACDYVEPQRRETALRFVLDAFNGKVDTVLARVKHDNAGKLVQEVRDAAALVNLNGKAFRNARVTEAYVEARLEELRWAAVVHELQMKERDEQRRIKEQIREEERARREYERAIRDAAKEEEIVRKAMAKAEEQLAKAGAEQRAKYEAQLVDLAARLAEAEARNQRALSMAQQTRRGHVYVISNVGSFGEHVYKIGLTRRLDPMERIRELGDSSVPFEFDVHALIFSEDAPGLEHRLHQHFLLAQVNKVNYRKEFFRTDLAHIRAELEALGLTTQWTMTAAAREYRETLAIEAAIRDDPSAREAWMRRQLLLEATDPVGDDEDREPSTTPVSVPVRLVAGGASPRADTALPQASFGPSPAREALLRKAEARMSADDVATLRAVMAAGDAVAESVAARRAAAAPDAPPSTSHEPA